MLFSVNEKDFGIEMDTLDKGKSSFRAKRVARLKAAIVLFMFILLTVPVICSIVLILKVSELNDKLDSMNLVLAQINENFSDKSKEEISFEGDEFSEGETDSKDSTDGAEKDDSFEMPDVEDTDTLGCSHKVYLTFDDGPSAYTGKILDILDEYGVKATFFVVGTACENYPEALKDIAQRGHSIGLHSYSHVYKDIYSSRDAFAADFYKEKDYIYKNTGIECNIFRFPGGSSNTVSDVDVHSLIDFLEGEGIKYYDWNISSGDGTNASLSKETLTKNVVSEISAFDTAVVLMHDSYDKPSTVSALPDIIEKIMAMEDTEIVSVSEDTVPVHHIN